MMFKVFVEEAEPQQAYAGFVEGEGMPKFGFSLRLMAASGDLETMAEGWDPYQLGQKNKTEAVLLSNLVDIKFTKNGNPVNEDLVLTARELLFRPLCLAVGLLRERLHLGKPGGAEFTVPLITQEDGITRDGPFAMKEYVMGLNLEQF